MPHLLLVDDDPNILKINRDYFESRGFYVTACDTPEQAIAHGEQFPVDCVILDIMMPGMDGFALCRQFKARMDAPVIFLTGFTEKEYLYQGFSFGGDDFLTKPCDLRELEVRVNARISQNQGGKFREERLDFPPLMVNVGIRQVLVNGTPVQLTAYEFDILLLLVRSPGHVFSPEGIYREVWKLPDLENAQTVKVHVARMRHKLEEACPGLTFITTVWKQGYRFAIPAQQGSMEAKKKEETKRNL